MGGLNLKNWVLRGRFNPITQKYLEPGKHTSAISPAPKWRSSHEFIFRVLPSKQSQERWRRRRPSHQPRQIQPGHGSPTPPYTLTPKQVSVPSSESSAHIHEFPSFILTFNVFFNHLQFPIWIPWIIELWSCGMPMKCYFHLFSFAYAEIWVVLRVGLMRVQWFWLSEVWDCRDGWGWQGESAEDSLWDEQRVKVFWEWGAQGGFHQAEDRQHACSVRKTLCLWHISLSNGMVAFFFSHESQHILWL